MQSGPVDVFIRYSGQITPLNAGHTYTTIFPEQYNVWIELQPFEVMGLPSICTG